MNTNDLPPAARLAMLIEAGRAANPDLKQKVKSVNPDDGGTCAMGFASLACGVSRGELASPAFGTLGAITRTGTPFCMALRVVDANDGGMSLDAICTSLHRASIMGNGPVTWFIPVEPWDAWIAEIYGPPRNEFPVSGI